MLGLGGVAEDATKAGKDSREKTVLVCLCLLQRCDIFYTAGHMCFGLDVATQVAWVNQQKHPVANERCVTHKGGHPRYHMLHPSRGQQDQLFDETGIAGSEMGRNRTTHGITKDSHGPLDMFVQQQIIELL